MSFFNHEKLNVYQRAIEFVSWENRLLSKSERKVSAIEQLHRASNSIPINIAEGNSKSSPKGRGHQFDVAYGSSLECAACLDVLVAWQSIERDEIGGGKGLLKEIASMLIGLRRRNSDWPDTVNEEGQDYGSAYFDHETLPVYKSAMLVIGWARPLLDEMRSTARNALDKSLTSVALNIAEGNGRFSFPDRARYVEQAHTSALRCAANLDVAVANEEVDVGIVAEGKRILSEVVKQLVKWGEYLKKKSV
ncbi:MAG: four helix bundle protein [Planctomycetota bacterium]|jgi:four helix bundle protein|nr:four helix bundle protein [Planctomycetota bacterium]MDP7133887.1 four helix bundle protein [Planctomycetota bacterium]MDP7252804.1 four helix bundle protein [Planctomycetota bacterium]